MGDLKTISISQMDPLEFIDGDECFEVTTSTRQDGGGADTVKKTFRVSVNAILNVYASRRDNPNQVTADQTGAFTREQVLDILQGYLGVEGVAVNSERLGGFTREEIIQQARSGTVHNSERLGGLEASEYVTGSEFDTVLGEVTIGLDEAAVQFQ